ncbi:outer membrane channel protein [compost metagenome]
MNAVDVLDRVKEEFRARRDLFQAQYNFITSLLVLHRWSGRLDDVDIRRANDWLVSSQ